VFVLYELEELSTEEIAQVLECPLETIKSRLRHARADFERLRRQRTLVAIAGGRR
jgi:DNA-directed RNA polymerase specialized sigma24 family protein